MCGSIFRLVGWTWPEKFNILWIIAEMDEFQIWTFLAGNSNFKIEIAQNLPLKQVGAIKLWLLSWYRIIDSLYSHPIRENCIFWEFILGQFGAHSFQILLCRGFWHHLIPQCLNYAQSINLSSNRSMQTR